MTEPVRGVRHIDAVGGHSPWPNHIVRIQLPTPYAVGPVNTYVVRGDRTTLVDVGPPTDDGEAALLDGLARAALAPEDIDQIVITHTHVDHHGGLPRFLRRNPDVSVAVHSAGGRQFGRERTERLRFYEQSFVQSGMPAPMVRAAVAGLQRLLATEPEVEVDTWLQDGDLVSMGDGTWRVLHTPGHAGSQICLYHEPTETIITGDHVLPHISSNAIVEPPPLEGGQRPRTLVQYLDALRRVASLPISVALPGHGDAFTEVARLVRERIDMHEQRLQHMVDSLLHRPATVYELATTMFSPLDGERLVLAMSEVQGHLDVLEARERVAIEARHGVSVYHARAESKTTSRKLS